MKQNQLGGPEATILLLLLLCVVVTMHMQPQQQQQFQHMILTLRCSANLFHIKVKGEKK